MFVEVLVSVHAGLAAARLTLVIALLLTRPPTAPMHENLRLLRDCCRLPHRLAAPARRPP